MRHTTLQTIAERLTDIEIATFRYQFPYMERARGGRESQVVALETVRSAVAAAHAAASGIRSWWAGTLIADECRH